MSNKTTAPDAPATSQAEDILDGNGDRHLAFHIRNVASVTHDANRRWCLCNGDDSQPLWEDAPRWQQLSAINGVLFHCAKPDAGEEAAHENWMARKLLDGWIYGPIKDENLKTHNCIVPYDRLPAHQRMKDRLFRTIVLGMCHELINGTEQ